MDINMDNDDPEDDDDFLQNLRNIRYDNYKSWWLTESICKKKDDELDRISESIEVIEWSLGNDYVYDQLSVEDQKLYPQYLVINKARENELLEEVAKCAADAYMDSVRYEQEDWNYQVYKNEKKISQVTYSLQNVESMTQDLVENANEELEIELELGQTCKILECKFEIPATTLCLYKEPGYSIGYPMETIRLFDNGLGKKSDLLMDMEWTPSLNWTTIILDMKWGYKRWILLPTVIHYVIDRGKYYL